MTDAMKKVSELKPGDLVDLEGDPFADPINSIYFECECMVVNEVIRETPECICVYFQDTDAVGFPVDHEVKFGGHLPEFDEA